MPGSTTDFSNMASNVAASNRERNRYAEAAAGQDANGFIDEDRFRAGRGTVTHQVREHNQGSAERNFLAGLPGGQWSSDPRMQAQQHRDYTQTDAYKKYFGALDPSRQLSHDVGNEAFNFREQLPGLMANSRDNIAKQAGGALDQGLRGIRSGMSNRGLLYSGLRQKAEGDERGAVANAMAKQIGQSNSELRQKAEGKEQAAAAAGTAGYRDSLEQQRQIEDMSMQNEIRRSQQWQQLAQAGGYAAGSYMGGRRQSQTQAGGQPSFADQYAAGYGAPGVDPYDDQMRGR